MAPKESALPPKAPSLAIALRALKFGVIIAIITGAAGLIQPNYYRSEAKILPNDSRSNGTMGQLAAAAASLGIAAPGQDTGDSNFTEILNSRYVLAYVLAQNYRFTTTQRLFGSNEDFNGTLLNYFHAKNLDDGIARLQKMFLVVRDPKTKVISVSAETSSPYLSQAIVTNAITALEVFLREKVRTKGSEKARYAEERLEEARLALRKSEDLYRVFLDSNRNYVVSSDPSVRITGARLDGEVRIKQQVVTTLSMNRELAMLEEKNDIPVVNVLDPANFPFEKSAPSRTKQVLISFTLSTLLLWSWFNRIWLVQLLVEPG